MKTQNLLAALFLIASISLGNFSHAVWTDQTLPVQELYDVVSCPNTSKVYLNQDNDADGLPDFSLYLNSNFILNGTPSNYTAGQILREDNGVQYTTVKYYTPLFNMLYKLSTGHIVGMLDENTFWRASRVFPYNTPVRGIATTPNQVVFEQPSTNNASSNTVSFLYDYKYKYANGFDWTSSSSYRYNPVPSMNYLLNTNIAMVTTLPGSEANRKRSWSAVQPSLANTTICRNYELHRCGNWVIDTPDNGYAALFTWELCDDGALNGTPGHCALGCGNAAQAFTCGDSIINDGSVTTVTTSGDFTYGPTYMSWWIEQIEQCDEWANNDDNYQIAWCSTFCEDNLEPESFPEELGG